MAAALPPRRRARTAGWRPKIAANGDGWRSQYDAATWLPPQKKRCSRSTNRSAIRARFAMISFLNQQAKTGFDKLGGKHDRSHQTGNVLLHMFNRLLRRRACTAAGDW